MDGATENCALNANDPTVPSNQNGNDNGNGNGNGNVNGNATATANGSENDALTNGNENVEIILDEDRKLTSDVWPHFVRLKFNGEIKAKCKYCRKRLGGDTSNGTSHLRNHYKTCTQRKIHDGRQRVLGPDYKPTGKPLLSATQFNSDVSRKELCSMSRCMSIP
ncbi:unnamed protein product [Linum tenue]|uniref:BED-type domain-containing protein n=1 Tax=Linum tenue TaxID=586396 RepID=A0AAV0HBY4_9ROSI|nr:unnamed protein product [Linum tenue]